MTDLTPADIAYSHEPQKSFVVYVFKAYGGSENEPFARKRLSWLRDCVCNDLASALTKAELVRMRADVSRVQVFEQTMDKDGNARTGRIIRTLNQSRWRDLLGFS